MTDQPLTRPHPAAYYGEPPAPTAPPPMVVNPTRSVWPRLIALSTRPVRRWLKPARWPLALRIKFNKAQADELAEWEKAQRVKAEQAAIAKRLDELASIYKRLLINALTRVGVSYMYKDDGKRKFSKVRFHKPAVVTPEAIYYQVDTERLPWHVTINDLLQESTLDTLSAATGRIINVQWSRFRPEDGFWFIVELKAGTRGIPRHADYSEVLEKMNLEKDIKPLTIPIGVGTNGNVVFGDIADFPHLIVAGATGQGKSVWVKQMLSTLVLRHEPARLKIIVVDLKGGVEFGKLDGLPHLLMPVIDDKRKVIDVLKRLLSEVEHRLKEFKRIGVDNITQYNQRRYFSNKPLPTLPYWIFIVDELANLMLDDEIKHAAEQYLSDLTARARAAGIHCILATQRPSVDVVKGLIKANVPVRIAFATSSEADSRVIIDSGQAYGLSPKGRMIYAKSADKMELQGAEITPPMFRAILDGVSKGERKETLDRRRRHNYSPEDFFRHSLLKYEGRFSVKVIYEDYKSLGVTRSDIEKVAAQYEGNEVEIDGAVYLLRPRVTEGRSESARLILISEPEHLQGSDSAAFESSAEATPPDLAEFQPIVLDFDLQAPTDPASDSHPDSGASSETEPVSIELN